jgi:hypothetical protein
MALTGRGDEKPGRCFASVAGPQSSRGIGEIEGKGAQGSAERVGKRASFNRARGIGEIEGKAAREAASEWSRRATRDIDGKTGRSNAREHMSQSGSRASFNRLISGSDDCPQSSRGIGEIEGKGGQGSAERVGKRASFNRAEGSAR